MLGFENLTRLNLFIVYLQEKKNITDYAQTVEFDFRYKTREEKRRQKKEAKAKLHSTIKKLKISGMEVSDISDITGETVKEILKILKS